VRLQLEELETRALLSASSVTASLPATDPASNTAVQLTLAVTPQAGSGSHQVKLHFV
jgi:hypothetical protein